MAIRSYGGQLNPREARMENEMTRTSIARLADDAPVADPDSWVVREAPRVAYIDTTPVMNAVHSALEAETRSTAAAVVKYRARAYALRPRDLDAIMDDLSSLSPKILVASLSIIKMHPRRLIGGEVHSINLCGALLYARYTRAKASQIARRLSKPWRAA